MGKGIAHSACNNGTDAQDNAGSNGNGEFPLECSTLGKKSAVILLGFGVGNAQLSLEIFRASDVAVVKQRWTRSLNNIHDI